MSVKLSDTLADLIGDMVMDSAKVCDAFAGHVMLTREQKEALLQLNKTMLRFIKRQKDLRISREAEPFDEAGVRV